METLTAFSILIAIVLFCFFIAAIYIYSRTKNNLSESTTSSSEKITNNTDYWKVVKGVVTKSKLDYKDSKGFFSTAKRVYRARFSYEYYAYDRKYTHSSLILSWTPSKEIALGYVNSYPVGHEVVVRFHPEHAETSVMEVVTKS